MPYKVRPAEKLREYERKARARRRQQCIMAYGGYRCACPGCGVTEPAFLSLDHIDGGGCDHRRQIGRGSDKLCKWLIKNDFPSGFQVLCHNCNQAKGILGYCPHEKMERDAQE